MRGGSRFEQLEVLLGPGPHEIAFWYSHKLFSLDRLRLPRRLSTCRPHTSITSKVRRTVTPARSGSGSGLGECRVPPQELGPRQRLLRLLRLQRHAVDPDFAGGSLVLSVYVNGADVGRRRDEGREPV